MDRTRAANFDRNADHGQVTHDAGEVTGIRKSVPARASRTRVEVDLAAIVANARDVKERVGHGTGVLAMLKANAYGHGLLPVAHALALDGTIAGMVVTTQADGLALRRSGIGTPILVLGAGSVTDPRAGLDAGLVPVLASVSDLEAVARAARARGLRAAVHVKLDTGMGRLGVKEADVHAFLRAASRCPEIAIVGLCTHLTSADDGDPAQSDHQLAAFEGAYAAFAAAGHWPTELHVANTAATFRLPRTHFSHVRTGIALFGGDEPSGARLRPAMRLVTHVAEVRAVATGDGVSYGATWRAPRPSRIATLPVGYSSGYPRRLAGRAEVLVHGRRCPVVGLICMEACMVDVTDLPFDVTVGDDVVLFGDDGADRILATDLAQATGGIVEEIFCGIPRDLPREYRDAGAPR